VVRSLRKNPIEPGDLDMIEDISLQASHAGVSEMKKKFKKGLPLDPSNYLSVSLL